MLYYPVCLAIAPGRIGTPFLLFFEGKLKPGFTDGYIIDTIFPTHFIHPFLVKPCHLRVAVYIMYPCI